MISVTPHPMIWTLALSLAGGDPGRIRVINETECVVVNERFGKIPAPDPRIGELAQAICRLTGAGPDLALGLAHEVWSETEEARR